MNRFSSFAIIGLALLVTAQSVPAVECEVVVAAVSRDDAFLRRLDPDDATELDAILMTIDTGDEILGANGLAFDSVTEELFVILQVDSLEDERVLATVDPETGEAIEIGTTGLKVAGLAFDGDGALYAVTGNGADPANTLYTLDTSDASATLLCAFVHEGDGEALGYSSDTELLYHLSGLDDPIIESVDDSLVDPCETTEVAVSDGTPVGDPDQPDFPDDETMALTWWEEEGVFLWQQGYDDGATNLYLVSLDGTDVELVGATDAVLKGIAVIEIGSCEPPLFIRGDGDGDGDLDIPDVVYSLEYQFAGTAAECLEALDLNNDDSIDLTDVFHQLVFTFLSGDDPADPYPDCGPDDDLFDALDCCGHSFCNP